MANELRASCTVTGLTLVARLYDPAQSAIAQVGGDIAMTEIGTTAVYYGNMAGAAGSYTVDFVVAATGVKYASGSLIWDGTAEVTENAVNVTKISGTTQTAADVGSNSAAIKTKTDSLNFTVPGGVDVNVKYVNDIQITGTGVEETDEWRPV